MMLVDRTEQLHDKETLIKELQNTVAHLTSSLSPTKPTYEE
jgi:tetrahydromethanopterin S-methyltransferase subunit B